ncbi:MAG: hypothetical protein IKP73_15165, partial [Bacteroidales bacterium]|nr:hypothetical protein [Bacteroidales bacterium]
MIWEDIMDAAGEDIKYNPRLIFTPKHKNWRHITMWASPNVVTKIFESLPYEVQKDIYVKDKESFDDLPDEAKERFNANYFATGGQTNPTPVIPPVNPPQNPKKTLSNPEEPVYDGGMLPEMTVTSEPMPWYKKAYRKTKRAISGGVDALMTSLDTPMMAQGLLNGSPTQSMLGYNAYVPSTVGSELEFAATNAAMPFYALKPVQLGFAGYGAYNLAGEDGVKKTKQAFDEGRYDDMVLSGLGDMMNLGMTIAPAANGAKRTIGKTIDYLHTDNTSSINTMTKQDNFLSNNVNHQAYMSSERSNNGGLFAKIKGFINEKRVDAERIKSALIFELSTNDYYRRLRNAGYSDAQISTIIADKKRAIRETTIRFVSVRTPNESYYSDGVAYIGTKGASTDEIVESIMHEVGHSDLRTDLEGLRLVRDYNERHVPAFRREYLNDMPENGNPPAWDYYGNHSEASRRAWAVIRWGQKNCPNKSLDEVYDIIQTKIINGEKIPKDVYDYVYSYNEPKSA